jgi:hypothetical protein
MIGYIALHRSHKNSTAGNSKAYMNDAVNCFLMAGTTLDNFLLTASGCLSVVMNTCAQLVW